MLLFLFGRFSVFSDKCSKLLLHSFFRFVSDGVRDTGILGTKSPVTLLVRPPLVPLGGPLLSSFSGSLANCQETTLYRCPIGLGALTPSACLKCWALHSLAYFVPPLRALGKTSSS